MKRGTSALIAASSRTVCVSTITSRNPCSADTTQDAREHAGVTWEALLKSTPGNRYAELLQSLKLVSRCAVANKRSDPRLPVRARLSRFVRRDYR